MKRSLVTPALSALSVNGSTARLRNCVVMRPPLAAEPSERSSAAGIGSNTVGLPGAVSGSDVSADLLGSVGARKTFTWTAGAETWMRSPGTSNPVLMESASEPTMSSTCKKRGSARSGWRGSAVPRNAPDSVEAMTTSLRLSTTRSAQMRVTRMPCAETNARISSDRSCAARVSAMSRVITVTLWTPNAMSSNFVGKISPTSFAKSISCRMVRRIALRLAALLSSDEKPFRRFAAPMASGIALSGSPPASAASMPDTTGKKQSIRRCS